MPSATETEFDAWPAMNASCTLSFGLGKPESPPNCRSVGKPESRPVSALCV